MKLSPLMRETLECLLEKNVVLSRGYIVRFALGMPHQHVYIGGVNPKDHSTFDPSKKVKPNLATVRGLLDRKLIRRVRRRKTGTSTHCIDYTINQEGRKVLKA